jgi:D-alanine-D-alanine ligase
MTAACNFPTPTTRIGVLCGGLSSERDVSLRSGKNALAALHRLGYQNARLLDVDRHIAQTLVAEGIELAYLALHGQYGEDGCIQGLLELLGIPYTGSGVTASALTIRKDLTKQVLAAHNLPVLPTCMLHLSTAEAPPDAETVFAAFERARNQAWPAGQPPYPLMVKPVSEGSSVGASRVANETELLPALISAASYSEGRVMLEPFVTGRDLTVGVLEAGLAGGCVATPILELRCKTGWYDLAAKYTEGLTEFLLPAPLPEATTQAIQQAAVAAHRATGCAGVSRVDFVLSATPPDTFYILEINTIPGMTDLSDLPAQAAAMQISFDNLVARILASATRRFEAQAARIRV